MLCFGGSECGVSEMSQDDTANFGQVRDDKNLNKSNGILERRQKTAILSKQLFANSGVSQATMRASGD